MAAGPFTPERGARWAFAGLLLACALAAVAWQRLAAARYATYEIRTRDSVSGLMADAPVEFHGVDVGKVERVALTGPSSVSVVVRVRKDAPVSSATTATITSRGLASKGFTGYVYVALEDDGTPPRPLARAEVGYAQIRAAPARSVSLDTAMAQVNANVQTLTRLMQTTLDERGIGSLKQTVDDLARAARVLADNGGRMETVLSNLERTSGRLDTLLRSSTAAADAVRTHLLPQASDAFVAVDGAAAAWSRTAQRTGDDLAPLLAAGRDSTSAVQTQLLPQTYDAVENLQRLTATLDALAQRLQRDPSLLLRGAVARRPGPGEQP